MNASRPDASPLFPAAHSAGVNRTMQYKWPSQRVNRRGLSESSRPGMFSGGLNRVVLRPASNMTWRVGQVSCFSMRRNMESRHGGCFTESPRRYDSDILTVFPSTMLASPARCQCRERYQVCRSRGYWGRKPKHATITRPQNGALNEITMGGGGLGSLESSGGADDHAEPSLYAVAPACRSIVPGPTPNYYCPSARFIYAAACLIPIFPAETASAARVAHKVSSASQAVNGQKSRFRKAKWVRVMSMYQNPW